MAVEVSLLGPDGQKLPPRPNKARALAGGDGRYGGPPYDAADLWNPQMAAWQPFLWSPDGEINIYRDRIVSRVRDMVRNDGWASGAVTRLLDNAIGASIRPVAKPDYRFLAQETGNKAFDHVWAKEFSRALDANWRSWAHDIGLYCDAARNLTFDQMMYLGFRHKLVDGDALAVMMWIPERMERGAARYATAVQMVDPDRLSNPQLRFDTMTVRGGVEIDNYGAAIAYHIRRAHAGDWFAAAASMVWDRVPRETAWGRPVVVHDFDSDRAATHRGGAGIFAPVLQRLKMLIKYDSTELESAIINAIFAAYIESPFDRELVQESLEDGERLKSYQTVRRQFHDAKPMMLGNARLPILFPGEAIKSVIANRPAAQFEAFENAVLRNVAAGTGLSAQQVSNNWSDVNYSSARGALLESWKTLDRRRQHYAVRFANPIRAGWLEESFERDDLPLPNDAPGFLECRNAYARCRWLGPGRGWVDPVAERQGSVMAMDAALSTLEDETAENSGLDYEEVLEQRSYELKRFDELGIPRPEWAGQLTATQTAKKPEAT